jgi:predicted CoA-substrate-specific enzyme activase
MQAYIAGIDIGSVSVSFVVSDYEGHIKEKKYFYHGGMVQQALIRELTPIFMALPIRAAAVTESAKGFIRSDQVCDNQLAGIICCKQLHPETQLLLTIGGEKFHLITFDANGRYTSLIPNSSCAAGTGNFLDQQAGRLNLAGSSELAELALRNDRTPPTIASRCSVFAKTDLIHAQASGYRLEEICDGLCQGLARNVLDTVSQGSGSLSGASLKSAARLEQKAGGKAREISPGEAEAVRSARFTEAPAAKNVLRVIGGVAQNAAVIRHLELLTGKKCVADEMAVYYGAYGACLDFLHRHQGGAHPVAIKNLRLEEVLLPADAQKSYYYPPLTLNLSKYPDFSGAERFIQDSKIAGMSVEVDIYRRVSGQCTVYLGIDVGSTSTKAALVDSGRQVIAGFYTRTAGQPMEAVQALCKTIAQVGGERGIEWDIAGVGTTGSGRKFVGDIIGADLALDEITAHARAAYELDPEIDTIIEIGGQDAKFTTLSHGVVTFSQMNSVCAAGTGSFIEEQAKRLGVALEEFSDRASGARAPLASDRCTVFMERDINHYLNRGYTVEEILATSLMSVRENYLLKVAVENAIGDKICFQGATAKNQALVAAFEQRLEKPIAVSPFCHLTGAIGAALTLMEEQTAPSAFRGLEIYQQNIPLRTEQCELCANRCRIRIAEVQGATVAFGFLCGRDYDTKHFVEKNRSGFDLFKARKRAAREAFDLTALPDKPQRSTLTIGIPAALHLVEHLDFWRYFFTRLGVRVVTSAAAPEVISRGKRLSGAEFCSPMAALYGHVDYLSEQADLIFLPYQLNGERDEMDKARGRARKYCYYTQYAPSVVALSFQNRPVTMLMPLLNHQFSLANTVQELYRVLKNFLPGLSLLELARVYFDATQKAALYSRALQDIYTGQAASGELKVVLCGRPYTALPAQMNKRIPEMFAQLGIKVFYQDMLDLRPQDTARLDELLDAFHWDQAARILQTAAYAVQEESVYPVLITSFKCSPDSFVLEYFKRILDEKGKPYLILQLDEHDSNVGYETRVEAAARAFHNHFNRQRGSKSSAVRIRPLAVNPVLTEDIKDKIIIFPAWDNLTVPMLTAHLRNHGYDVRFLQENEQLIQKSMRHNTGQCIPVNAIAQEFIEYLRVNQLQPEQTVLWMLDSAVSCNIKLYPHYIKTILENHGLGEAGVYSGKVTLMDLVPLGGLDTYFAFLFGGLLRQLGCRTRPYELVAGATDQAILTGRDIFTQVFLGGKSREEALEEVYQVFAAIPADRSHIRPRVAIFGDFYVRDNEIMNQQLIHAIEAEGGEVITTSFSELMRITSKAYFKRMRANGHYVDMFMFSALLKLIEMMERKYYGVLSKLEWNAVETDPDFEAFLAQFHIRVEQEGESFDNMLKIFHILQEHPEVALFVQASPAFCCPSLITEAMRGAIEAVTGVPVISITYDGTGSYKNGVIAPYLRYASKPRDPQSAAPRLSKT